MSSIDAVIAQARRPGTFAERRRFSVARTQAIEKLRSFALADPFAYVLELIQSAVANGAVWIDLSIDAESVTLSYVGGGIPGAALSRLFDFLFAAKDRADLGYVRELALGVNALLLFAPDKIVIESGDGTKEGTTRVELHGGGQKFDVGRPDHVLSGTFVRAEGMRRAPLATRMRIPAGGRLREQDLIESRCLTAPVPIVLNGEPVFGYSSMRVPQLFGYPHSLTVDEGDLYGTLVRPMRRAEVSLLTRGVLLETVEIDLAPGASVGGVICFDGLRKTADHARVVRDERLEEVWLRLRPYALELTQGRRQGGVYAARLQGGQELRTAELRALVRERGRAVAIAPGLDGAPLRSAQAIARALDAPLIEVPADQVRALRILAGESARVFAPDLHDPAEVDFYLRPLGVATPARPWLVPPVPAPALTTGTLVELILAGAEDTGALRGTLAEILGDAHEVKATVYTPATTDDALVVELWMVGRQLARVSAGAGAGGHVLVAELPELPPGALLRIGAVVLAEAIARHADGALREAGRRVVEGMSEESCIPGHGAARRALAAAVRGSVLRLRGGAAPGVEALLLEPGPPGVDLLALPLLRTLGGAAISVRELLRRAREETFGLVYGALDEVPPDLTGLDAEKILRLDAEEERQVVALVGEAVYVRVDARQVCAEHLGVVCRDLALGLRSYPDFPLLVEGVDPTGWPEDQQRECLGSLLRQLEAVAQGGARVLAGLSTADAAELRRHALRHLQWYALRGAPEAGGAPLARALGGGAIDAESLLGRLAEGGDVWFHCWHGPFPGVEAVEWPRSWLVEATPFVYQRLAGRPGVRAGFDFAANADDLGPDATEDADDLEPLASATVRCAGVEGTIAAPAALPQVPAVLVYDAAGRRVHVFTELARDFGIVGVLRSIRPAWEDRDGVEVAAAIVAAAERVVADLLAHRTDDPRALAALADFVGRHVQLVAGAGGVVRAVVTQAAAERVLSRPLFAGPWEVPRSGWRIVQAACDALSRGVAPMLEGGPALRRFLAHLQPARVVRPAARRAAVPPAAQVRDEAMVEVVTAALERWLHALRPDLEGAPWEQRGRVAFVTPELAEKMGATLAFVGGSAETWRLTLNPSHWLVGWLRQAGEPRALAWLLLGCYAAINDQFVEVTGSHEQEFQRRVADALVRAELRLDA